MDTAALGDYRALRRSSTDRRIAGVAGGLARHLDIDPLLVRVLLVVLVFFGGSGLLLYAALWLLVPDERDGHVVVPSDDSTRNVLVIVALVVAALIALTTGVGGDSGGIWFLSVVAVGALAFHLVRQSRRNQGTSQTPRTWSATETPVHGTYAGPPVPPYRPVRRRRGPLLLLPTLALVAVGLGVLGLIDSNGYEVPDAGYAALALAIIGGMLVVGSFFGRAGGLILVGLVSAGALGTSAIAEPSYDGDRDQIVRPTSTSDLADTYSVPAGRIEIDLTRISEPSALAGRRITADVNAGEIVVIVPPEVAIDLEADVRYGGAIETPDGLTHDRWGADVERTYAADGGSSRAPLVLDPDAAFGHLDVRGG